MPDLDSYLVRHALTVAREQGYAEVELACEGASFFATLEPRKPAAKVALDVGEEEAQPDLKPVKSTLVGFVQSVTISIGDKLEKGTRVAVISALGLANDVESSCSGEVVEICVEAGQPVEYGQPIAKVICT